MWRGRRGPAQCVLRVLRLCSPRASPLWPLWPLWPLCRWSPSPHSRTATPPLNPTRCCRGHHRPRARVVGRVGLPVLHGDAPPVLLLYRRPRLPRLPVQLYRHQQGLHRRLRRGTQPVVGRDALWRVRWRTPPLSRPAGLIIGPISAFAAFSVYSKRYLTFGTRNRYAIGDGKADASHLIWSNGGQHLCMRMLHAACTHTALLHAHSLCRRQTSRL